MVYYKCNKCGRVSEFKEKLPEEYSAAFRCVPNNVSCGGMLVFQKEIDICVFTGKEYDCNNCEGHKEDWTGKGSHDMHMGHSIDGPLSRNTKREWQGMAKYLTDPKGGPLTGEAIHLRFLKMHEQGQKTIPLSEGCDRWCFKNGCQGHANKGSDS